MEHMVEQMARMNTMEREQLVQLLVSKWPTMAQELQDAIGYELMTQEQYAEYHDGMELIA
jgi:hypothetical protein